MDTTDVQNGLHTIFDIMYLFFSQARTARSRLGRNPASAPEVVAGVSNSKREHVRTRNPRWMVLTVTV